MVTTGADPVGGVEWSPAGDWLAFTLLPGGGLNSQIYVVRPDGTGLRRLTDGGKENNWLSRWTWDGRHIVFSSNRRDPAAMDSWMVDVSSGTLTEVARNPGIGSVTSVSEDGRRMVLSRLRLRGDNNLHLIDRERGTDTLLTEHEPPALFEGEILRSGRTVYLSSNKDRDLFAFIACRSVRMAGRARGSRSLNGRTPSSMGSASTSRRPWRRSRGTWGAGPSSS